MFLQAILTRMRKGSPTQQYPLGPPPTVPSTFTGAPTVQIDACIPCELCMESCPTGALRVYPQPEKENGSGTVAVTWELRYDQCTLCGLCVNACPESAISASGTFELAVTNRADLVVRYIKPAVTLPEPKEVQPIGA